MIVPGAISVVIPTHNRAERALAAIASALEQTLAPLEVLVCDDASDDDTEARLRALAARDERVRYLRLERNAGGPAAPRNAGVEAARGEWIAFLDDDDEWVAGKLAAQASFLDRYDLVAADALRRSTRGRYLAAVPVDPDHGALLRENLIVTSTVLVRRDQLRAVGGFPESPRLHGIEDYAAWLRLAAAGARIAVLDEPLAIYGDESDERFAGRGRAVWSQLARLHVRWWLQRPTDLSRLRAAGGAAVNAVRAVRHRREQSFERSGSGPPMR